MLKKRHLFAGLLSLAFSQVAVAQTFTVTNTADSGAGSLRQALTDANTYAGTATINFSITNSTINLSSMLPILTNPNGITINGNGNIIDGGSTSNTTGDRVFFIGVPANTPAAAGGNMPSTAATNWNINNLTIQNGNARGGRGGGGGAGFGGGLFLNAGNLTLSSVNFTSNKAIGGNGGNGGGGGMGGNGASGGGGFGIGANGGANNNGVNGQFSGGAPGGSQGAFTGGIDGGGGAGSLDFISSPIGGGGGIGGQSVNGGKGGFGGGGGLAAAAQGGIGGYGGGGGNAYFGSGGNGGFGGGGGGGDFGSGAGGFGGGNGAAGSPFSTGGGGLGAGGAIFVRQGASITIQDGGITGGTVTGGTGANAGQAIGSGIFLAGSVNYSVTTGTLTISDTLGGGVNAQITGGFTKSGAGTLVLGGTNTYTGGTNINVGSLSVSSDSNLGNSNSGLTFNGGMLQITGNSFTSTPRSITWGASGGGFDIADAANTFAVSQALTSGGSLTKLGAGTLVLSGANTYTGSTTLSGTAGSILRLGNNSALGVATNSLSINAGNTLDMNGASINIGDLTGAGTITNSSASTPSVLSVGNSNGTSTFSGVIQNGSQSVSLVKVGTGTLVLSKANTYTGGTTVNGPAGSTLKAGNNAALGTSTNNLSIAAGNNFDINNFAINVGGLSGTGNVTNTGGGGSITAGNGNASSTFDGVITQASSANPLTVGKVGTGMLTLNGNNSYTGSTVVFGGTLLINGNQSAATGGVLIAGGAKLGGNGTVGGDVTLDGAQMAPGNSPGILTLSKDVRFQNGASFQVEIQGTAAGTGYDQLLLNSTTSNYVITGNSTLVGTRLGGFNIPNFTAFEIIKNPNGTLGSGTFAGLSDGAFFDFDGMHMQIRYNVPNNYVLSPGVGITWAGDDGFGNYGADNGGSIVIAAVPEPSTWALILGTLSICGYVAYRRSLKSTRVEELLMEDC